MKAYYNEYDPKAAAWLRELIKRGLIADGEVDERSILEVKPDDLSGFTQCHFFAGIGGWSYALRLAGWPDDQPVWTGSPPCQPFSSAGQRKGKEDERHLAPHFAHLVDARRPPILFGEQVASAAVFGKVAKKARGTVEGSPEWAWFNDLQDRLEAAHYAVGVSDIPAAGVGAPHIRQRTFFGAVGLADADSARPQGHRRPVEQHDTEGREVSAGWGAESGKHGGLADAERGERGSDSDHGSAGYGEDCGPSPLDGFWRDADWLFCRDKKWRPVEPGTFPLAHGIPARVVRLRGYGNAIVPQAAAEFVRSFLNATH